MIIKTLKKIIKLKLKAGKATAAPPVGPRLSQAGINVSSFCKEYNFKTSNFGDQIIPAKILIYNDKSYDIILLSPPTSKLILDLCKLSKGSACPQSNKIATISLLDLKEIVDIKAKELNSKDLNSQLSIIAGTAKSMGIKII